MNLQDIITFLNEKWYWIVLLILILMLVLVVLILKGRVKAISFPPLKVEFIENIAGKERRSEIVGARVEIFDNSSSTEFNQRFFDLAKKARKVVFIGIGLSIVRNNDAFIKELLQRVKSGFHLEIYAANPFSPMVEARLIEEEAGELKPSIGRPGLIQWLEALIADRKKMGNPVNYSLRLFSHYPTMALFILDESLFFYYTYANTRLGTFSPVTHYTEADPSHKVMIEFLKEQYTKVKEDSVDAGLVFDLYHHKRLDPDNFIPFAVYLIPDEDTPLYKFGSSILGYDVRRGQHLIKNTLHSYVGAAADFGFHLTVADALYFIQESEIKLLAEEIRFLATKYEPFTLSFKIRKGFPNSESITLVCQDESGALEALHHEMVGSVYRKAAASNYSLGLAKADRDQNVARNRLMIEQYRAPYILQQFKPHFSLLSSVPPGQIDAVFEELEKLFNEQILVPEVDIKGLCLMARPRTKLPWQIRDEICF